jgi:hypothetical protein
MVWLYCDECGDTLKKVRQRLCCLAAAAAVQAASAASICPVSAAASQCYNTAWLVALAETLLLSLDVPQPKLVNHFRTCRGQSFTCVDCSRSFDRQSAQVTVIARLHTLAVAPGATCTINVPSLIDRDVCW